MLVKLKTALSGLDGSWGPGLHDLPDKLAEEMLAAGFAEMVAPAAAPASPPPAQPKKGKEKAK